MSDIQNFDPSRGHHVRGIQLSPTVFMATTNFDQLVSVTRHPADLQANARLGGYDADAIAEEAELHSLIQRAMIGNKKSNVPKYTTYIEEVVLGQRVGVLPPMHLWSSEALETVEIGGRQFTVVPNGLRLLSIDGETQLTGHYELHSRAVVETRRSHGKYPLAAVIHHGITVEDARQFFHDLNVLSVRPNTSLGLSMDTADPIMKIVAKVEQRVSFINGRVERQARQLAKNSPKLITLQTERQMIINLAKGIQGIAYGAKPVPIDDTDVQDLADVATMWLTAIFDHFGSQISDRETYLIGSGTVLAVLGALGHVLIDMPAIGVARTTMIDRLIQDLTSVDWRKGDHWQGIAGRYSAKGTFSVSGTKEVGYNVFNVLTDPHNPNYHTVRHHPAVAAAS